MHSSLRPGHPIGLSAASREPSPESLPASQETIGQFLSLVNVLIRDKVYLPETETEVGHRRIIGENGAVELTSHEFTSFADFDADDIHFATAAIKYYNSQTRRILSPKHQLEGAYRRRSGIYVVRKSAFVAQHPVTGSIAQHYRALERVDFQKKNPKHGRDKGHFIRPATEGVMDASMEAVRQMLAEERQAA